MSGPTHQHTNIERKLATRSGIIPRLAWVPFCGEGDILAQMGWDSFVACDTNPLLIDNFRQNTGGEYRVGHWRDHPLPDSRVYDHLDIDPWGNPFPAIKFAFENLNIAPGFTLSFTDGTRQDRVRKKRFFNWQNLQFADPNGPPRYLTGNDGWDCEVIDFVNGFYQMRLVCRKIAHWMEYWTFAHNIGGNNAREKENARRHRGYAQALHARARGLSGGASEAQVDGQ